MIKQQNLYFDYKYFAVDPLFVWKVWNKYWWRRSTKKKWKTDTLIRLIKCEAQNEGSIIWKES